MANKVVEWKRKNPAFNVAWTDEPWGLRNVDVDDDEDDVIGRLYSVILGFEPLAEERMRERKRKEHNGAQEKGREMQHWTLM